MTGEGCSHLSSESLLLILSGELVDPERQSAFDHLASCSECCQRLEETGTVVGELRQAVEKEDFHLFSARLASVQAPPGLLSRLAGFSATAVSAAAALTVGLLIWNSSTPPVSATELLDRAVREESRQIRVTRVRVRDAAGVCTLSSGTLPVVQDGPSCERIRSRLEGGKWDWRNPLSAEGFQRWRSSLDDKHDTVTEEPGVFQLRTSTSRGELRAATLQVRTRDFHPITMRLEFAESAMIEISEDSAPETIATAAPELSVSTAKLPNATPVTPEAAPQTLDLAEPMDAAEIQLRIALHERQADRGYETAVHRGPDGLEVFGLVRGPERREELATALAYIPGIRVKIKTYAEFQPGDDALFPSGEQGNTLPPLASKWLKSAWPEQEQSAAFVNRAGQLSSALLGEATVLHELTQRCDALSGNPDVEELLRVRKDHQRRMADVLSSLRASLEPIAGPLGQPSTVTIEQARTLQSAITRLFSASGSASGSLEDEIGRLRSAFGAAK